MLERMYLKGSFGISVNNMDAALPLQDMTFDEW